MTVTDAELLDARILLVDDRVDNLYVLEQMLQLSGYRNVSSTSNPREVCALYRQHNHDLIVLDLQMPGMDGFEVMAQLAGIEQGGYLPVLVLTAQPSQKLRALQAGAKDFVSKPYGELEIQTRIRNMLEVRLLYKRLAGHNRELERTVAARTAELRESEARFRSLVELASDWYWEQDENGQFTKVSGPALEMLGLAEQATVDTEQPPRWNEADRAQLGEKLATRRPFLDFVYRRTHSDGSEQYLQTSGEPKFDETGRFRGYRGIGMDVTGRMLGQADPALQRFRDAMDAGSQGIFIIDRGSMRFVDANASACKLTGYSREELLARGPRALIGDPDEDHEGQFDRLISGADTPGNHRSTLLHKDGRRIAVEVHRHAGNTSAGWLRVDFVRALSEAA